MLSQVLGHLERGQVTSIFQNDEVSAVDECLRLLMPVDTAQSIVARRQHEDRTPDATQPRTLIDAGGLKPQLGVEDALPHFVGHRQSDLHDVLACPSLRAE